MRTDRAAGPGGTRPVGRVRLVVTGLLILAVFATLMSLGVWQVRRLHWKEGLLAKIAARMHAPPVPLSDVEALYKQGKDIEYRHVRVSGTFDNSKERHFLATFEGQSGFDVFTPLTTDSGQTVFVNRGFVPYDRKAPSTRPQSLAKGPQTITGLAREAPSQKPSSMVPENSVGENIFYWKDLKDMAASTGLTGADLVPFFVDADRVSGSRALPIGGATVVDLPNNHLQYAFTWFGLAVVLVLVTGTYIYRHFRGSDGTDSETEDAKRP